MLEDKDLTCVGCGKHPSELQEYQDMAESEDYPSPADFVWHEEGTLNRRTGKFACTSCYIKIGQPSSSTGWTP